MGLLAKINTLKKRGARPAKGLLKKSVESLGEYSATPSEISKTEITSDRASGLLGAVLHRTEKKPAEPSLQEITESPAVSESPLSLPPEEMYGEEEPTEEVPPESTETDKAATPLGIVPTGLDSVISFFHMLYSRVGFGMGALLVAVMDRADLIPCAIAGFDEETMSLLAVEPEKVSMLFSNNSSDSYKIFSGKRRNEARMFFSDQDFDALGEIFFAPVYADNNPISLLILSGISDKQIRETQTTLIEDYTSIVEARYSAVKKMGDSRIRSANELDRELELIRESSKAGLSPLLYKISYASAIRDIAAAHPFLSIEWLESEIRFIIGSFLGTLGNLYELDEKSVMLVCQHASELDEQLIAHQASTRLRNLYSNTEAPLYIEIESQKVEILSAQPV